MTEKVKASVTEYLDDEVLEAKMMPLVNVENPDAYDESSEISSLRRKSESLISIPPDACSPWNFADRLEEEMGDIDALATSISRSGQQEPILVRESTKKGSVKYEIIFGNRRWRACQRLNIPVKAILKQISDQEAAIAQKEENDNRQDISDYTRAIYYKKLLDKGVFRSQLQMAKKMGIGNSTLGDLLSYTRIPERILAVFQRPHKISKTVAVRLASMSDADDMQIKELAKVANKIEEGRVSYRNFEELFCKKKHFDKENLSSSSKKSLDGKYFKLTLSKSGEVNVKFTVRNKNVITKEVIAKLDSMVHNLLPSARK